MPINKWMLVNNNIAYSPVTKAVITKMDSIPFQNSAKKIMKPSPLEVCFQLNSMSSVDKVEKASKPVGSMISGRLREATSRLFEKLNTLLQ